VAQRRYEANTNLKNWFKIAPTPYMFVVKVIDLVVHIFRKKK
jgi:hypothetical protein